MLRVLFLVVLCGLFAAPLAYSITAADDPQVAPIPVKPGAALEKDEVARHVAWTKRILIEPMLKRIEGQPWAKEAAGFAEQALPYLPHSDDSIPPEVIARGAKLVEQQGCEDPAILFLAARMQPASGVYLSVPWYRKGLAKAQDLPGPKVLRWLMLRGLAAATLGYSKWNPELKDLAPLGGEILGDGSFTAEEQVVLVRELLADPDFHRSFSAHTEVAKSAQLAPWARETIAGHLALAQWFAQVQKGIGDPKADPDELIGEARRALTAGWQLKPDHPEAAARMITLVSYGSSEDGATPRIWFDRAVAAQFDYAPAYRGFLRSFESSEQLLQFGEMCFATNRFDTIVPRYLFAALYEVSRRSRDWKVAYRSRASIAKAVLTLSKNGIERAETPKQKQHALGLLAVNAFLVGDFETAIATCKQLNPTGIHTRLFSELSGPASEKLTDLNANEFFEQIQLATGAGAEAFLRAHRESMAGNREQEIAALEQAVAKVPAHESTGTRARLEAAKFEQAYNKGEWVALQVKPQSAMWNLSGPGSDQFVAQGLALTPPEASRANFAFALGDHFEVETRLRPDPKHPGPFPFRFFFAGRKSGVHLPAYGSGYWASIHVFNDNERANLAISDAMKGPFRVEHLAPLPEDAILTFRFQDGEITVLINGKPALEKLPAPPRQSWMTENAFSFDMPPSVSSAFTELKVRKLQSIAPEVPFFPAERSEKSPPQPALKANDI